MTPSGALVVVVVAVAAFIAGSWWTRGRSGAEVPPAPPTGLADTDALGAGEASSGPEADEPLLFARLSQAVDEIEQGVIVCDADGTDLFRNRVAQTYLEARDGLVLVEAAVQDLLAEALAGRSARREVDLFGPPAQSFIVSAYPFGEGAGGLVLVEDRSLQRRTETVRRDFVANISHELKTPIGALGLLAETIRDEPDPDVVARLSSRMITEADRASRTVDDLLELSRIEFGDDAEMAELSAIGVIGEAVGRIASAAEHAGIDVRVDVDPELHLVGDRRQLVSAVFNLLDNAVKYSPDDAEVLVQARSEGDGWLSLAVTDNGIGIPRRDLDRIFERFYRVDRARSRGTGGTGLGLAIVRHVASNHGGEVAVESTEGIGSTFTLILPAASAVGELPGSPSPRPPRAATNTPGAP
jgi:two-component system sensor histidine kinase SenX3